MFVASQVSPAPPLVFVISGPSGVGKDAVIKQLQLTRPKLHFVVTATSRKVQRHVLCCGNKLSGQHADLLILVEQTHETN